MWNHVIAPRLTPLFWAKVSKTETCWLWGGTLDKDGYGVYSHWRGGDWRTGKMDKARTHMAAYVMAHGPIPEGLTIDHLCRVRACCNPAHLEAVTVRQNTMRGGGPTAVNAAKDTCEFGHPFRERGYRAGRFCPTCAKAAHDRYKASKRDEINERRRANWLLNRDELNAKQRARRASMKGL